MIKKIIVILIIFILILSTITYLFFIQKGERDFELLIQDLSNIRGSSGYPGIFNEYGLINSVDIYEDKLVYASNQGLFLYNLSTDQQTKISSMSDDVISAKIFGNNVIWFDDNSDKIKNYNIKNRIVINITNDNAIPYMSRIYGNYITWIDDRHDNNDTDDVKHSEIYLFDLNTGIEKRLTNSFSEKRRSGFGFHNNLIAWDDHDIANDEYNIKILDIESNTIKNIDQFNLLDIDEKNIVFTNYRELSLYCMKNSEVKIIVDKIKVLSKVSLYNDILSFITPLNNLMIYEISSGEIKSIVDQSTKLEDEIYDIWSPVIWKHKLAWASKKDGIAIIHICTINEIEEEEVFSFQVVIGMHITISIVIIAIFLKYFRKKRTISLGEKTLLLFM